METEKLKVLGFRLDTQWFAMDIGKVREVVEWPELTNVPLAPECALGVFNYHGKVITVVDPKYFFGIKLSEFTVDTRIIIFSGDDAQIGFRVDCADKIELIPREEFQTGKEAVSEKSFIRAVVHSEDRLYNILDPEPLLDMIEDEFSTAKSR